MAPKKSFVVILADPKAKKSVTRYDAAKDSDPLQNAYIDNKALTQLGNPAKVKVTIEAA
jgi:hypothetical protein